MKCWPETIKAILKSWSSPDHSKLFLCFLFCVGQLKQRKFNVSLVNQTPPKENYAKALSFRMGGDYSAQCHHYRLLDEKEQAHLQKLIQVFIAEKNWEGAGGLELNDEIRVTIAAQACLLILDMPHNYYRNVESIIIYPTEVVPPQRRPGFFETPLHPLEPTYPIVGQAFHQGPLIFVWDAVLRGGRYPGSGYNVVYHEFAHKLDMLDGAADGTPPLKSRGEYSDWVKVFSREYLSLQDDLKRTKDIVR